MQKQMGFFYQTSLPAVFLTQAAGRPAAATHDACLIAGATVTAGHYAVIAVLALTGRAVAAPTLHLPFASHPCPIPKPSATTSSFAPLAPPPAPPSAPQFQESPSLQHSRTQPTTQRTSTTSSTSSAPPLMRLLHLLVALQLPNNPKAQAARHRLPSAKRSMYCACARIHHSKTMRIGRGSPMWCLSCWKGWAAPRLFSRMRMCTWLCMC